MAHLIGHNPFMTKTELIAANNLVFKNTLITTPRHKIVFSEVVSQLDEEILNGVITAVREFKGFNKDNDPYNEKDFGRVTVEGNDYFFKIDLYDDKWEYGFDRDSESLSKCNRLMTIMRSDEYWLIGVKTNERNYICDKSAQRDN